MTEALEPTLTLADIRVLNALPQADPGLKPRPVDKARSLWEVAETLRSVDLHGLQLTLNGLVQLDYVEYANSTSRRMRVYWRSLKGDVAVA